MGTTDVNVSYHKTSFSQATHIITPPRVSSDSLLNHSADKIYTKSQRGGTVTLFQPQSQEKAFSSQLFHQLTNLSLISTVNYRKKAHLGSEALLVPHLLSFPGLPFRQPFLDFVLFHTFWSGYERDKWPRWCLDFPESEANQGSLNEEVMVAMNELIHQKSLYDSTTSFM